jgi:ketosteroid isomerase-like protein
MRMMLAALIIAAASLAPQAATAQIAGARTPGWAQTLVASDVIASTGGRSTLQGPGIDFSVRVTVAPNQGGVARVIRIDGLGGETRLHLRRFTGHPTAGWWIWGPETPATRTLTPAQRVDLERLASAAVSAVGAGDQTCPAGEQAFVEIFSRGRSTVASRACLGADPVSVLARAASDLGGSRTEEELHEAAIAELLDADRAFNAMAQAEGVPAAFAQFAAEDAAQFGPGQEPARTPEERAARWRDWGEQDGLAWAPMQAEVSDRGDLGWTWGNAVRTGVDGAAQTERYVTVWRRHYDGGWRFVADIGVPGPPLVAPAPLRN